MPWPCDTLIRADEDACCRTMQRTLTSQLISFFHRGAKRFIYLVIHKKDLYKVEPVTGRLSSSQSLGIHVASSSVNVTTLLDVATRARPRYGWARLQAAPYTAV